MPLQDLLDLSRAKEQRKIGVSEERINQVLPHLRNYIASTTGDIYQDGQLRLIIESETKDTLGCIDLYNLDIRNRKAGIGIYIAQHARKQG